MPNTLNDLIESAMKLSFQERAQLTRKLLVSLEEPAESEIEQIWIEEAKRRLQEYRNGKSKGIPAEKVFNRAIKDIS